jgi:NADH:ubiquinone oxidoreductase subunit 2 (subunit N)
VIFSLSFSLISSISKGFKTDSLEILGSLGRNSISQYLVNLFNIGLLFLAPIFLFILSEKYKFTSAFTPRMYVVSITIIVVLVFSLVYFLRLIRALFVSTRKYEIQLTRIEPATIISSILLCIIAVSLLILIVQFIGFCSLVSSSLLG